MPSLKEPTLDRLDRKILRALQTNSQISNQSLADEVGLSAAACWRRVRRLEEAKVISGYVALLDPEQVGCGFNVFIQIRLEKHRELAVREFEEALLRLHEVVECYSVSGGSDYLLRIVVKDMKDYEQFHTKKLIRLPGVSHVESNFTIKTIKYTTALPLSNIE